MPAHMELHLIKSKQLDAIKTKFSPNSKTTKHAAVDITLEDDQDFKPKRRKISLPRPIALPEMMIHDQSELS